MHITTIGIKKDEYKVKDYILSRLSHLNGESIEILFEDNKECDFLFIKCNIKDNIFLKIKEAVFFENLTQDIATILSDVIINNYESTLIKKVVKNYYIYISDAEKEEIYKHTNNLIKREENISDSFFYKQSRKMKIKNSISNYLKTENLIILDGFINFRLSEYMKELYLMVDKAVDDFITQKEYNEFIKLLRYFVEIQDCKVEIVHIVINNNNEYILLDGNKSLIKFEGFEDTSLEIEGKIINDDDFLISSLITIAPKRIVIHCINGFRNKELFKTIQGVFQNRIELCFNCKLCNSYINQKN